MLMKALAQGNVLYQTQVYPDENHALPGVKLHLYRTMEAFLDECFQLDASHDEVGLRRRRIIRQGQSLLQRRNTTNKLTHEKPYALYRLKRRKTPTSTSFAEAVIFQMVLIVYKILSFCSFNCYLLRDNIFFSTLNILYCYIDSIVHILIHLLNIYITEESFYRISMTIRIRETYNTQMKTSPYQSMKNTHH